MIELNETKYLILKLLYVVFFLVYLYYAYVFISRKIGIRYNAFFVIALNKAIVEKVTSETMKEYFKQLGIKV